MNQRHPRNQILHAAAAALEPLVAARMVEKIAVSLTSSKDQSPYIAVRSDQETVERIDTDTLQRTFLMILQITVHADDEAQNLLDELTWQIEQHINAASWPDDLFLMYTPELAGTEFPDLPGEQLAGAQIIYRITYHTQPQQRN